MVRASLDDPKCGWDQLRGKGGEKIDCMVILCTSKNDATTPIAMVCGALEQNADTELVFV